MSSLRRRIAEVEEDNGALLAFARGHAGAVAAIHEAVLAALTATDRADLAMIVTRDWPCLLGVDAAALAWADVDRAFAADRQAVRAMEPRLVARMAGMERAVSLRSVMHGHPLFGFDSNIIRAEVAIRLEGTSGIGLIVLGQCDGLPAEAPAGTRLLRFLGRAASTMLERWPASAPPN